MTVKRALVVDDSRSARVMLTKLLQKNGIDADSVESGEEALEYLENHTTDIVFMDHMMPGIDGFEATRRLASNPHTAHIPVVMCTSKEGDEYIQEARAVGASAILPKPSTWALIADAIAEIEKTAPVALPEVATPKAASTVFVAAVERPAAPAPAPLSEARVEEIAYHAAETAIDSAFGAAMAQQMQELIGPQLTQLADSLRNELHSALAALPTPAAVDVPAPVDVGALEARLNAHVDDALAVHLGAQLDDRMQARMEQVVQSLMQNLPTAQPEPVAPAPAFDLGSVDARVAEQVQALESRLSSQWSTQLGAQLEPLLESRLDSMLDSVQSALINTLRGEMEARLTAFAASLPQPEPVAAAPASIDEALLERLVDARLQARLASLDTRLAALESQGDAWASQTAGYITQHQLDQLESRLTTDVENRTEALAESVARLATRSSEPRDEIPVTMPIKDPQIEASIKGAYAFAAFSGILGVGMGLLALFS